MQSQLEPSVLRWPFSVLLFSSLSFFSSELAPAEQENSVVSVYELQLGFIITHLQEDNEYFIINFIIQ